MKNWVWLIGFYINISLCFTPNSTPIQPWLFALNPTWNCNFNNSGSTTFCNFRNFYSLPEIQEISVVQTIPNFSLHPGLTFTTEASIFRSPTIGSTEINQRCALKIKNTQYLLLGLGFQRLSIKNPNEITGKALTDESQFNPVYQIGFVTQQGLTNNGKPYNYSKPQHGCWITIGRTNPLQNTNRYAGNPLTLTIDSSQQIYPKATFPFTFDYQLGMASKQLKIPVYITFHYESNNTYLSSNLLIAIKAKKEQYIDLQIAISNTPVGCYFIQNNPRWFLRMGGNWHPQLGISPCFQWFYHWNKSSKKA